MKYAVIKLQGHQYKVEEGTTILVDKLADPKKPDPRVLLLVDGDKVTVGKPEVKGASVTFKVLAEEEKGEKVTVLKYKAKSRYRRKTGFRPVYTKLQVSKITSK